MDPETTDALEQWKKHRYRPHHIPFRDAVDSLLTDTPLIELQRSSTRRSDWIVCLTSSCL